MRSGKWFDWIGRWHLWRCIVMSPISRFSTVIIRSWNKNRERGLNKFNKLIWLKTSDLEFQYLMSNWSMAFTSILFYESSSLMVDGSAWSINVWFLQMAHRFIQEVYSICCDHQTELSPFVYWGEGKLNSVKWAIYFGSTKSLVVDYGVISVECLEQDVDTPGQ